MGQLTSALSWAQLQTSDQLTAARRVVYEALCKFGPQTAGELTAQLKDPSETRPSYHKRVSELVRQGVVKERRTRRCIVSGRDCIEWEAIPGANPKPLTAHKGRTALESAVVRAARTYAHEPTLVNRTALLTAASQLDRENENE